MIKLSYEHVSKHHIMYMNCYEWLCTTKVTRQWPIYNTKLSKRWQFGQS